MQLMCFRSRVLWTYNLVLNTVFSLKQDDDFNGSYIIFHEAFSFGDTPSFLEHN